MMVRAVAHITHEFQVHWSSTEASLKSSNDTKNNGMLILKMNYVYTDTSEKKMSSITKNLCGLGVHFRKVEDYIEMAMGVECIRLELLFPPRQAKKERGRIARFIKKKVEQFTNGQVKKLELNINVYLEKTFLRRVRVVKKHTYKKEDDKSCVICLEEFVLDSIVFRAPCKHIFHKECIGSWFAVSGRCPICRYKIDIKEKPPLRFLR